MTEPNLLREQFPYTQPPLIVWENQQAPFGDAFQGFITDTTFRDGQQARTPYTVSQITNLFDLLHRLGGPRGLIRQSEFFLYSETDREAVVQCMERGYEFPEVTAWIRADERDFARVTELGIRETGILTSCSDYHIFLKLGWDREEAMRRYTGIVKKAIDAGVRPRCHFEDITRADIEGFVVPLAAELMKIAEDAKVPVRIRLCDTMGYGLPFENVALPRSVPRLARVLQEEAGVPGEWLEWHGHNDFHLVVANALAAWMHGVAGINGTLLGFGERTGNTPIEAMVIHYLSLTGDAAPDTTAITDIAHYMAAECGYTAPPMTPFVGSQFNVTSAGIHADGLLKFEEIYNIFDTGALLNRPLGVAVTDKAGTAGVAWWVNQQLSRKGIHEKVDKRDEGIAVMTAWVRDVYANGRTTKLSDEELSAAASRFLPRWFA